MSQLISREKALEIINNIGGCDAKDDYSKGFDDAIGNAYHAVSDMHCDYDVDDVVKQLELLMNSAKEDMDYYLGHSATDECIFNQADLNERRYKTLCEAIEIVQKGGAEC